MTRHLHVPALAALGLLVAGSATAGEPVTADACLPGGDGSLKARVRGAIDADIDWSNAQMTCEGGMRPGGKGASIAGPLAEKDGTVSRLRFVFGIALRDTAQGEAQALPTNLTVIVEGKQTLFATLGDDKCAVEQLEVTPLLSSGTGTQGASRQHIKVRGYCIGPATDLQGTQRLLVSTFEFTSQVNSGDEP
jgi:hypothetical protein